MSSADRSAALHDGDHSINFVGVVITNDILGRSRFKSNIRRNFDKREATQKAAHLKGGKVILFNKAKLGNGKVASGSPVATMKTGRPSWSCIFVNSATSMSGHGGHRW
jgi:hypothetical protein